MKRAPRGYLLLEISIGGALIALLVGVLLTQLADARIRGVLAGRDVVASQLAQAQIERERSIGYNAGAASASCVAGPTPVSNQTAVYNLECLNNATTRAIGTLTLNMREVRVKISYTTEAGGLREIEAFTEVYQ